MCRNSAFVLWVLSAVVFAAWGPNVAKAQPIAPEAAVGMYSGGGVMLTASDLQRIAFGDDSAGAPRGGGMGNVLLVECSGAYGYSTIQGAIDDATDGDVVVVLPNDCEPDGRWHENIDYIGKAIRVQSANPANEAIVEATVIDGDAAGSVVTFADGEQSDSVIDGFTLTNGRSVGSTIAGGGIACSSSSPTIRRCILRQNTGSFGSAIGILESDGQVIEDCQFVDNEPGGIDVYAFIAPGLTFRHCQFKNGGGLGVVRIYPPSGGADCLPPTTCGAFEYCRFEGIQGYSIVEGQSMEFAHCDFVDNTCNEFILGARVTLSDCLFEGNISRGFVLSSRESTSITNSSFLGNTSESGFMLRIDSGLQMSGCEFANNHVNAGTLLYAADGVSIMDTVFSNNTAAANIARVTGPKIAVEGCAFESNESGVGAIQVGGAPNTTIIRNSTFLKNTSAFAAAAINGAGCQIVDCLVAGNTSSGQGGGAIRCPSATVEGCTVVGNRAEFVTGGVYASTVTNSIVYDNRHGNIQYVQNQIWPVAHVEFSDVENLAVTFPIPTTGQVPPAASTNFDLSPQFVEPGSWDDMGTPNDYTDDVYTLGDYHLLATSPCIDGGDPAFVPEPDATDIDDEPRVMSCRVDMGADEFTQDEISVPGDFDGDGAVTVDDVPAFLAVTLEPIGLGVCRADLNGDGFADGRDVAAMAALLLGQ